MAPLATDREEERGENLRFPIVTRLGGVPGTFQAAAGADLEAFVYADGRTDIAARTGGAPTAAPTVAAVAGGAVDAGRHHYGYSYTIPEGETPVGPAAAVTNVAGTQTNNLSAIAAGPGGTTGINLYRTKAATDVAGTPGSYANPWFKVDTILPTATTYSDTAADSALGAALPPARPDTSLAGAAAGTEILAAFFVPDADITGDPTDFVTLSVLRYKPDGTSVTVASLPFSTAETYAKGQLVNLGAIAHSPLDPGDTLSVLAHQSTVTGLALPTGVLELEAVRL